MGISVVSSSGGCYRGRRDHSLTLPVSSGGTCPKAFREGRPVIPPICHRAVLCPGGAVSEFWVRSVGRSQGSTHVIVPAASTACCVPCALALRPWPGSECLLPHPAGLCLHTSHLLPGAPVLTAWPRRGRERCGSCCSALAFTQQPLSSAAAPNRWAQVLSRRKDQLGQ